MPLSEDPKPSVDYRLKEVARFSRKELSQIHKSLTAYLDQNPRSSRGKIVRGIAINKQHAERLEDAITVIDQLAIAGVSDVTNVTVFRDPDSVVTKESYDKYRRAGEDNPHYFYDITLRTDISSNLQTPASEAHETSAPKTVHQLAAERAAEIEKNQQERAERNRIDGMVIDTGKEDGEKDLAEKFKTVTLGNDGIAIISVQTYGRTLTDQPQYVPVDRKTGEVMRDDPFMGGERLSADVMRFLESEARRLEGDQRSIYRPEKLDQKTCKAIFDRAVQLGMLTMKEDIHNESSSFSYRRNVVQQFGEVDLEKKVVRTLDEENDVRPLHPDFAAFLKKKIKDLENK